MNVIRNGTATFETFSETAMIFEAEVSHAPEANALSLDSFEADVKAILNPAKPLKRPATVNALAKKAAAARGRQVDSAEWAARLASDLAVAID